MVCGVCSMQGDIAKSSEGCGFGIYFINFYEKNQIELSTAQILYIYSNMFYYLSFC